MVTRLVTAAFHLRRRVYASLPWGYRLANLLTRLAADTTGFGQVTYGLFLMHGVEGMPPIKGEPAETFKPSSPKEIDRKIPPGYGADFGKKVYRVLLHTFKDNDFAEEVMSEGMLKIITGDNSLSRELPGKQLSKAENLFIKSMVNLGIDIRRKRGREKSMVNEEGVEQVLEDPRAWKELETHLPEKEIDAIRRELAEVSPRLAPDLPLYFDLLLEGFKDSEIVKNQMLPFLKDKPMSQQAWSKTYKEHIKRVLREHFDVN